MEHSTTISERNAARALCKVSFYDFVKEFWGVIITEEPVWNWHIEYLCNELQKMAERVFRGENKLYDLVINISPGSTKSTICSRMFPAWVWTRMAQAKLICASYTHPLALSLSLSTRDIIQSDHYKELFPEIRLRVDQNTKGAFLNSEGGERRAYGVGGQITGFHGHFVIIDDPLDPQKAASEAELVNVNKWMSETIPTRKVNKAVCPTILIMQRLHQNDPAQNMIDSGAKKGKIKLICLPAEYTKAIQPASLTRYYINGLMDPSRMSREVLDEYRETLGEYGYACQFLQTPIPRHGGQFKPERIRIDQPSVPMVDRVRYWDKAGSHNTGCYTAGVLVGKDSSGRFWVLDVVRGRWSADEREVVEKATAELDGKIVRIGIEQEPGSGGKESAESTVRMLAGYRIVPDRPIGDKVLRAEPFAVQVNSGNVSMVPGEWNKAFIEELRYFPSAKYKDQVDASSAAFALLCRKKLVIGAF